MNDDFLYKFRKPPRREFAAALYQRISKPMKTTSRTPILRYTALAFSMVAVIAAVLFFSPSTRAFADSLIRQIGGYIFVQAPPKSEPDLVKKVMDGQQTALSPDQEATLQAYKKQVDKQMQGQGKENDQVAASFAPDAAAASQLAGFTVLAPAYVPDGYTIGSVKNVTGGWAVSYEDDSVAALISYTDQNAKSFLTIEELKYQADHPKTVERPEIDDVTVRGQPGVWMPDEANVGKSALVWEENGITYTIVTNTLSRDELLKIAESLGK